MDLLRRPHAPLSAEAWKAIDETVLEMAKKTLAARRIATFDGPHGVDHLAVAQGTMSQRRTREGQAQVWVPDVVSLSEIRVPFSVPWAAFDAFERGAPALAADPAEDAARELALAEDRLVLYGEPGSEGFLSGKESPRLKVGDWAKPGQALGDVVKAVERLDGLGIPGPYELVLTPSRYFAWVRAAEHGYPTPRHLKELITAAHRSAVIKDAGALFSTRGDDFVLTVGGDLAVGYRAHDRDAVHFFCVETIAAQTMTPEAVVILTA
ncbi:MAG: bacteriocin family protein [Candidatus Rokubacteria bacterium]|nr:bacteriocin family protein [Candidatus Rokubacteria bacterium]